MSTFGRPELVKLGECKVIEEVMIGEDKVSVKDFSAFFLGYYSSCKLLQII